MVPCSWNSKSPQDTFEIAAALAKRLKGGEVILLTGTLGSGKTIFAKGIASAHGVDPAEVSSPTFSLVNHYRGELDIYHLDLYRLPEGESAAFAVDLDGLLALEEPVIVIEWADRLGTYPLRAQCIYRVAIADNEADTRSINISS